MAFLKNIAGRQLTLVPPDPGGGGIKKKIGTDHVNYSTRKLPALPSNRIVTAESPSIFIPSHKRVRYHTTISSCKKPASTMEQNYPAVKFTIQVSIPASPDPRSFVRPLAALYFAAIQPIFISAEATIAHLFRFPCARLRSTGPAEI